MNAMTPLLEARAVSKHFGGLIALDHVSLTVGTGEIFGLIGPNGAGKSTFFNVLTGVYSPTAGETLFEGAPLPSGQPHKAAQKGIARTFQNIRLFGSMTALENVMVGRHVRSKGGIVRAILRTPLLVREERETAQVAREWLNFVGIGHRAQDISSALSYGDQRRLEIARALASSPKLLALDEPAAGMNSTETEQLGELLKKIQARGISVLLIEHDVKLVLGLCDRVAVLDYGKLIAMGPPAAIQNDPLVIEAYLGQAPEAEDAE